MPSQRDSRVDAFFPDEWAPFTLVPNPRGVHFSRFTSPFTQPLSVVKSLRNPLDPSTPVSVPRPQPESHMLAVNQGRQHEYLLFVPPATLASGGLDPGARLRATVLFGAFDEYNRHGLRTYFEGLANRVLVYVPGVEAQASTAGQAWGIGITSGMVRDLLTTVLPTFTGSVTIDTVAGYSTGYRGVNGTINNAFIAPGDITRLIFFDALYWGDQPPLPSGTTPPPDPPGVSVPPNPASPRNTWRMLNTVRAANPGVQVVTYEVTEPGGTPRDGGMLRVDVPAAGLINLKPRTAALTGLVLARVIRSGIDDGFVTRAQAPAIAALGDILPRRGALASSSATSGSAASGALDAWAAAHGAAVASANASAGTGLGLIQSRTLMGWGVPSLGDMLHDGFVQEFGWEFLAG
ncbi:hypothetical protein ACFY8B_25250 [Streptomyces sp. NPDC012751]|uniref:hypothetical protein n=1 Tax=Streptomyces sp. NPDC012751 TaxID=3364846 RepID=UPI00369FC9A1